MSQPPAAVKYTIAATVILCENIILSRGGEIIMTGEVGKKYIVYLFLRTENYLETAKKYLLNDPRDLLEILLNFDKDSISDS